MRRRSRNIPRMPITKNADSGRSPQRLPPEPHFSSPLFRQILPTRVRGFDQSFLFLPPPAFQLLFTIDCALDLISNVSTAVRRERLVSASLQPASSGCFDSETRLFARLFAQHDKRPDRLAAGRTHVGRLQPPNIRGKLKITPPSVAKQQTLFTIPILVLS